MRNPFTEHPKNMGESYLGHLLFAAKFGVLMLAGAIACFIHAIFPFIFKDTGSNFLFRMIHDFISRMPVDDARIVFLATEIKNKT